MATKPCRCGLLAAPLETKLIFCRSAKSPAEVEQDPRFTLTSSGQQIGIPKCAVSISRTFRARAANEHSAPPSKNKRRKTPPSKGLALMDTAVSDDEDAEDITFLFSDAETPASKSR